MCDDCVCWGSSILIDQNTLSTMCGKTNPYKVRSLGYLSTPESAFASQISSFTRHIIETLIDRYQKSDVKIAEQLNEQLLRLLRIIQNKTLYEMQ